MRYFFFCLSLAALFFLQSFTDGGGYSGYQIEIDCFDQEENFYYFAVDDTVKYLTKKGKERSYNATMNVGFYDIDADSSFYLFKDSIGEHVVSFVFEEAYVDSTKSMEYLVCGEGKWGGLVSNNKNISSRSPNGKILIATYSRRKKDYSLWRCNKDGSDLERLTKMDEFEDLRMDVFNQLFLIKRKTPRHHIERIEY